MGSPLFNLLPELQGSIRFRLPNAPPHPQAGLRFDGNTPPVFSPVFARYSLSATFLCPTYVHSPSI